MKIRIWYLTQFFCQQIKIEICHLFYYPSANLIPFCISLPVNWSRNLVILFPITFYILMQVSRRRGTKGGKPSVFASQLQAWHMLSSKWPARHAKDQSDHLDLPSFVSLNTIMYKNQHILFLSEKPHLTSGKASKRISLICLWVLRSLSNSLIVPTLASRKSILVVNANEGSDQESHAGLWRDASFSTCHLQ